MSTIDWKICMSVSQSKKVQTWPLTERCCCTTTKGIQLSHQTLHNTWHVDNPWEKTPSSMLSLNPSRKLLCLSRAINTTLVIRKGQLDGGYSPGGEQPRQTDFPSWGQSEGSGTLSWLWNSSRRTSRSCAHGIKVKDSSRWSPRCCLKGTCIPS